MSLRKLWNSIRGRSVDNDQATKTHQNASPRSAQQPSDSTTGHSTKSVKASSRGILSFASRSPEVVLAKMLAAKPVRSVLEVGVGDGSRASTVLDLLQKKNPGQKLRYCAIDQFEMGDGPLTMRDFNSLLRGQGISPQIFPHETQQGLLRVLHTVGLVDAIILGEDSEKCCQTETIDVLRRVCHNETRLFFFRDGMWRPFEEIRPESQPARNVA